MDGAQNSDSESENDDNFFPKNGESDKEEEEVQAKDDGGFTTEDFLTTAQILEAFTKGDPQMEFLNQDFVIRDIPDQQEQMIKGRLRVAFSKAFKKKQKMFRKHRANKRREIRNAVKKPDHDLLNSTGIRTERRNKAVEAKQTRKQQGIDAIEDTFTPLSILPPDEINREEVKEEFLPGELDHPASCYICKHKYSKVHHFYDNLCPKCAPWHYAKRLQTCDLSGQYAILTGGRIKIGFEIGLKLLRAGANLLVTTRFPKDAIFRYSQQPDFSEWRDRLKVYGLDLRFMPMLLQFVEFVHQTYPRVDIIVNNACQTVRRPPEFYAHLRQIESQPIDVEHETLLIDLEKMKVPALENQKDANADIQDFQQNYMSASAATTAIAICDEDIHNPADFPEKYNEHNQRIDLRATTSWTRKIGDVAPVEIFEVTVVNSLAPFIIANRLKDLLLIGTDDRPSFVVNVSAMEGKFSWKSKKSTHPHTNMAKASLNMMTRTCAKDLAEENIFMTSVDTGWITDEIPASQSSHRDRFDKIFHPPLDEVDGAARCVDPIFAAVNGEEPYFGVFLKDYKPTDW